MRKKIDYNLIDYIPEEDVPDAYKNGLIGAYAEPDVMARLLGQLETPLFGAAAYYLTGTGEGKVSTPYKFIQKLDPGFGKTESQTTGDCVSHGTRNAGSIDYGCDCILENREFAGRFATENIYGWRGHGGQGASCSRLAEYVHSIGGYLTRKKYENGSKLIDLSIYNSRIGANWGISGTPDWLNKIAAEHPAETISLITTIAEARDAIANGYGISVCSSYGFSSSRDSNGVSEPRGSWSHCMAWIGCDDSEWAYTNYKGPLFLIQNSWGANWNSGGKHLDQCDGSFWIRGIVAQKMLNQRGSFVISNVKGFKQRKLNYMLI
jgi:hypothetical protein